MANSADGLNIDTLLRTACENKASDLHLKVGNYPYLRVDGELRALTQYTRISSEDMLNMAFSMMTNRQKQKFKENAELDMAYGVAGLGRFRVNVFQQRGNVGMVLRVIPTKIRTLEELLLPRVIDKICQEARGMVLVTGTTGSGKSTTLAAMVDRINSTRTDHIITIEDPIEFLHRDKKGFVQPARSGSGYAEFRQRPARRPAPGSRRHSGGRNARPGNHPDRAAGRGNRPHGVLHLAHHGRHGDDPAYYRGFPAPGTEADSLAVGEHLESDHLPAPGAQGGWHWPRSGRGSADRHRVYSRLHHQSG